MSEQEKATALAGCAWGAAVRKLVSFEPGEVGGGARTAGNRLSILLGASYVRPREAGKAAVRQRLDHVALRVLTGTALSRVPIAAGEA